jgi:hypothetical protein
LGVWIVWFAVDSALLGFQERFQFVDLVVDPSAALCANDYGQQAPWKWDRTVAEVVELL